MIADDNLICPGKMAFFRVAADAGKPLHADLGPSIGSARRVSILLPQSIPFKSSLYPLMYTSKMIILLRHAFKTMRVS